MSNVNNEIMKKLLDNTKKNKKYGSDDIMFIIHRSLNENVVCYKGTELENNYEGCYPFWLMTDGKKEELNVLEKYNAYGLSVTKLSENKWKMNIISLNDRNIIIVKDKNNKWKSITKINGKLSQLLGVHVQLKNGWVSYNVDFIEIFGINGEYEKKTNT